MVAKHAFETLHKDNQDETPILCIFRKGKKSDTVKQVNLIIILAFPTTVLS